MHVSFFENSEVKSTIFTVKRWISYSVNEYIIFTSGTGPADVATLDLFTGKNVTGWLNPGYSSTLHMLKYINVSVCWWKVMCVCVLCGSVSIISDNTWFVTTLQRQRLHIVSRCVCFHSSLQTFAIICLCSSHHIQ